MSPTNATYTTRPANPVSAIDWIALVLLIVGGINWGLVGAFNFDLVAAILGTMSVASRVVYIVVGLAALYTIYFAVRMAGGNRS